MCRLIVAVAVAIINVTSAGILSAQSSNGSLRGRLTDGGRISQKVAAVPVVLQGSNFQTRTDSSGRWEFSTLPAATYRLIVTPARGAPLRRVVAVQPGAIAEVAIDLREGPAMLEPLVVTAARPLHVIGHLPGVRDNVIYAGKKWEVITLDSLHANLALDVERQILGRIPGANFSETAGAGFPSNGVGFRGLNPTQSVEMNTRQNGVNIRQYRQQQAPGG